MIDPPVEDVDGESMTDDILLRGVEYNIHYINVYILYIIYYI